MDKALDVVRSLGLEIFALLGAALLLIVKQNMGKIVKAVVEMTERKSGLDLSDALEARLSNYALMAVEAAEEWARGIIKTGAAVSSSDKMEKAVATIKLLAGKTSMSDSELTARLQAALDAKRNSEG